MSKTVDYLNPSGNTITIGASGIKLTSISAKQNENITELTDDLIGKTAEIQSAIAKADAAEATAKDAKEATDTVIDDITALQESVRECYSEISKTSEEISLTVREEYISRSEMATIQQDFQSTITQNSSEIRMDFSAVTDELKDNIATNQELLEEYIRFKGALIELGKVGNAFTAELSNNELAFKENGQKIAYIPNLVRITPDSVHTVSTASRHTAWWVSCPARASAAALPAHPDKQAAITALARTVEFLSAWKRRTAAGVLLPMPMISVLSLSSAPVICPSRMQ